MLNRLRKRWKRWLLLMLISLVSGFLLYKELIRPYVILRMNTHSEHWKYKSSYFNKLHYHRMHVFFGNSLTAGLTQYLGKKDSICICGINGDFTEGLLHRMDSILMQHPATVHIEIGINDVLAGFGKKRILRNYKAIVRKALDHLSPENIYVQSILPVSFAKGWMSDPEDANQTILLLNKELKVLSSSNGVHFMDLHKLYFMNGVMQDEFTTDGVHLTDKGYKIWVDEIRKTLDLR